MKKTQPRKCFVKNIYGLQCKIAGSRFLALWHPKGKRKFTLLHMKSVWLMNWLAQCYWIGFFGGTFILADCIRTMSFRGCHTSSVQGDLGHENIAEFFLTDQALSSPVILRYSFYDCVSTASSHQGTFRHVNLHPSGKLLWYLFSYISQLRMFPDESCPG